MDWAGCDVICEDGSQTRYDGCIMAVHAPDALKILGQATHDETRILGAFQYEYRYSLLCAYSNVFHYGFLPWRISELRT